MLIGFIGKMGSGKSTAADYLVENHNFVKHNFKDALDKELVNLYPILLSSLGDGFSKPEDVVKRKPSSPALRELKQKHGTDVRRAQDPDYWTKKWVDYYYGFTHDVKVCVDDVRFQNEVDIIKSLGGMVVRIERTDITDTGDHLSEIALDGYKADFTITADKGDQMMVYMSLDNILNDGLGREEDSYDSGAYEEYAKELS